MAGITKDTPDPDHGRFFRDESGDHTGRVAELARNVFNKIGTRETFTPEQQRERGRNGMRYISELLTAAGLTTVHDAGAGRDRILAYEDAKVNGELRHRAAFLVRGADTFAGFKAAGVYYGFGDEWLRVTGVKFAADGSASERTMRMSTPYVGTTDYGILTMTQQEIDDAVEDAWRHNFRVAIHANGDVTIDMVLKAYERVQKQWPRPDPRNRIEHCSLVNPDLLGRIKAAGVHADAVLDLRALSWGEVEGVRRREDELDVRPQVLPRIRHPRAGRLGLRARSVRAADGAAEHGDAQGLQRQRVGTEAACDARRGADHRHAPWRLRLARGSA